MIEPNNGTSDAIHEEHVDDLFEVIRDVNNVRILSDSEGDRHDRCGFEAFDKALGLSLHIVGVVAEVET